MSTAKQGTTAKDPLNGQLCELEIKPFVRVEWKDSLQRYECEHMGTLNPGRYELFTLRLADAHPKLGVQTRPGAMCCACYQKLRDLGLAAFVGTWELIDAKTPPK